MARFIGRHAIVVGAGIAGLTAAKALASHFARVTVLERDALPSGIAPRRGIPQGQHVHALRVGGLRALDELFPGIERDMEAAGAVRLTNAEVRFEQAGFDPLPQREFGVSWLSASRPLFESVIRQAVARESNIELRQNCRVAELVSEAEQPAIRGVRYDSPHGSTEMLSADLVVDASGRGTMTLAALEDMGFPVAEEEVIGVDFAYSTAIFELSPDARPAWKTAIVLPSAPASSRGAVMAQIEDDRWIVSVGANHGDVPPGDIQGFLAYVGTLRTTTISDAIRAAKAVGDISRYGFPSSTRRHFEECSQLPRGLLVLGDALCRFNPVYAHGMSVAAQEAVILGRLLSQRAMLADPLDGLAPAFFADIQTVLETPWNIATNDFIYPMTRGTPPADLRSRIELKAALTRMAVHDPSVHRLLFDVNNLLKPQSALRSLVGGPNPHELSLL